jgi:hypothetical protein
MSPAHAAGFVLPREEDFKPPFRILSRIRHSFIHVDAGDSVVGAIVREH